MPDNDLSSLLKHLLAKIDYPVLPADVEKEILPQAVKVNLGNMPFSLPPGKKLNKLDSTQSRSGPCNARRPA